MVWAEDWSYLVNGHQLNDRTKYFTQIPEIDNTPDYTMVTVPIDGTYPSLIRADPTSGTWSILIQMVPCDWATYQTQLGELRGWLPIGVPATLAVQIRGMGASLSALIVPKNLITVAKNRSVAITCHVPIPVLA